MLRLLARVCSVLRLSQAIGPKVGVGEVEVEISLGLITEVQGRWHSVGLSRSRRGSASTSRTCDMRHLIQLSPELPSTRCKGQDSSLLCQLFAAPPRLLTTGRSRENGNKERAVGFEFL
ncbi:hypothetical protein B0I35DRAFT_71413 [Stachybotrys elegans]|uniref:Secreted protein n=1 Tax=Stachybotrys elegans TaxID=80388 RepID=A0A8K0SPZ9_9HYPO|nr:hypothetical protein B0I35DRAFT_71413 [Stachybotrys elegans]